LVLWEWLLAPLRPGGSWLLLKALPLAATLLYVLGGSARALQFAGLLLPFYVAEAIVRLWSESGRAAWAAGIALLLALAALAPIYQWARNARRISKAD
jgi:uncharacterized membrane protein